MSAEGKISQARLHLTNLEKRLQEIIKTDAYRIDTKRDANRRIIYYVSYVPDIPEDLNLLTGDVIHNLRSALDHLINDLIEQNGNGTTSQTAFPIFENEDSYKKYSPKKLNGLDPKQLKIIDDLKPYKTANKDIWAIHALDIIDKHRLLITTGGSFESMDIGAHLKGLIGDHFPHTPFFISPANNLCPLEIGTVLFTGAPDEKENPDMKFKITIALYEPDIIDSGPLIDILNRLLLKTESIIRLFD